MVRSSQSKVPHVWHKVATPPISASGAVLGTSPSVTKSNEGQKTMPIVRLIYTTVPPGQAAAAEKDWKEECAPLMIRQPGCESEEMLRCTDKPGEYISYSKWKDAASIDAYLKSADHQEIKRRTSSLTGVTVVVKNYDLVG
jgi:heme-degrading monooxygenase HmoA